MTRVLTGFCLIAVLISCKTCQASVSSFENRLGETIYFVMSVDSILSNPNDIARIRPITFESDLSRISDNALTTEDQDRLKQNLFRHRIEHVIHLLSCHQNPQRSLLTQFRFRISLPTVQWKSKCSHC